MELYWWQSKVLGNIRILYLHRVFNSHPLQYLGSIRARGNGRPAAEGFEHGFLNDAICLSHFNLELHYIAAGRCTNEPSADIWVFFVKRTNIARVFVMVEHVFVVGKVSQWKAEEGGSVEL